MLEQLHFSNQNGEELVIDLKNTSRSGFIIRNIDGLGPAKGSLSFSSAHGADGQVLNHSRLENRNIVLDLVIDDRYDSPEYTRQKSYKVFPVKGLVDIAIKTDLRRVKTQGYVEHNTPIIFSSQVSSQVSIICPNPYFLSEDSSKVEFFGLSGGFSFPFSNSSTTSGLLKFGDILSDQLALIEYPGDIETGLVITATFTGESDEIAIHNVTTNTKMQINTRKLRSLTGRAIGVGDTIVINTNPGKKSVLLHRGGQIYNILGSMDRDSKWLTLIPGNNMMAYSVSGSISSVSLSMEYNTLFAGL